MHIYLVQNLTIRVVESISKKREAVVVIEEIVE